MAAVPRGRIGERLFQILVVGMVALGFLALVIAAGVALRVVYDSRDHTAWVNHTAQVERAIFEERLALERIETARRGFLLQQNPRFIEVYREMRARLPVTLDRVAALTRDNPAQQSAIVAVRAKQVRQLAFVDHTITLVLSGRLQEARDGFAIDGSVPAMRVLRHDLETMSEREARLLDIRTQAQLATGRRLRSVLAGTGVLLVLVALSSIWLILRNTRQLNRAADDLRRLNEGLEDMVAERTTDLQRANDEIQRFAYIVSHDLRSPLVNVMGFTAELEAATKQLGAQIDRVEADAPALLAPDAALAAREDLPEAIGFIRSSTEKMDRLINAILRLSREGRRTLSPQPLDMAAMIDAIGASLRHRLDEVGGGLAIEGELPGVVNDRLAVEQILSNLIENAVKYRSPNRPLRIAVSGRRIGPRVVFEIADNGRGIDPRDHERVFELFRRSGAQDQAGEGIGLAHVRALAYRLGGMIACDSALDAGATFRLSLPAIFTPEDPRS